MRRRNSTSLISLDCELRRIQALRQWEDHLQESDCIFARLVYVSLLRDASGRYADPFLVGVFPARTSHKIVADAHRQIFREWLALDARIKLRDFQKYCQAICNQTPPREADWTGLCRELVPSGISIDELDLFCGMANRLAHVICGRDRGQTE